MADDEEDSERQQIEWVFGLTGSELEGQAWNGFAYNYEGVPEWAFSDFEDRFDRQYHTVIGCFLFGGPPSRIVDESDVWTLQQTFVSSGETECPLGHLPPDEEKAVFTRRERIFGTPAADRCFLCDEKRGNEHGYIYLGDGWGEATYRLETDQESGDEDEPDQAP